MNIQSRIMSKGTYLIGSNLVLPNSNYFVRFIEGSGIVKVYNNENRKYILFCEYLDEEEINIITLDKGMLISVEGTLKVQLVQDI